MKDLKKDRRALQYLPFHLLSQIKVMRCKQQRNLFPVASSECVLHCFQYKLPGKKSNLESIAAATSLIVHISASSRVLQGNTRLRSHFELNSLVLPQPTTIRIQGFSTCTSSSSPRQQVSNDAWRQMKVTANRHSSTYILNCYQVSYLYIGFTKYRAVT